MHSNLTASVVTAAAIGLSAVPAPAAPAVTLVDKDAVSYTHRVGYYYYGDDGYYVSRPACPYRYYYACWSDLYGRPHCGCRPGIGFYLFRFY
jgi:hypothetical protein